MDFRKLGVEERLRRFELSMNTSVWIRVALSGSFSNDCLVHVESQIFIKVLEAWSR